MFISGLTVLAFSFCSSYRVLLPFYAGIIATFASSFLSQYVYWKCRSASEEMCFQESLGSCWKPGDSIWLPALVGTFVRIITTLAVYPGQFKAWVSISIVVVVQLLMIATKWWVVIELEYIVSGIMFVWFSIVEFGTYEDNKERENIAKQVNMINMQLIRHNLNDYSKLLHLQRRNALQHKLNYSNYWENRFTKEITDIATYAFAAFAFMFICYKFIYYITTLATPEGIQIWQWLVFVVAESLCNPITLLGIIFLFGKLSYLIVVLINIFLGIAKPRLDDFRYEVEVHIAIICIESGLFTIDERIRERCLEVVIAMALFIVVCNSFSCVKHAILALVTGGGYLSISQCLRLFIVVFALTIVPFWGVFELCTRLKTSAWPFFNAFGNFGLLIEMIFMVIEFLLFQTSWWFRKTTHIIHMHILFYVRHANTAFMLVASCLMIYYKLMSMTIFTAYFWLRIVLNLVQFFLRCEFVAHMY